MVGILAGIKQCFMSGDSDQQKGSRLQTKSVDGQIRIKKEKRNSSWPGMKKAVKFSFTLHCRTAETEYKSERNAGIVRGKLTNKEEQAPTGMVLPL